MVSIGIIAEYSPFHNGHIYHIDKIKKMFPDSILALVMSSSFTQRGLPSIIDKWNKTDICLNHNIDLVVELPYIFSTQSADYFAREAINILNNLNVDYLVFGSESNDINLLKDIANCQLNNDKYQNIVNKYLDTGINYPSALNKALVDLGLKSVNLSNDLLGLSYVKEIIRSNSKIKPITIKRNNNYLSKTIDGEYASATSIRELIANKKDISKYVPIDTLNYLNNNYVLYDQYFKLLKYKINSDNSLSSYLDVDEGIDNRIYSVINEVNSYEELIDKLKSKRYTYNKINRMLCHILCGLTKEFRDNNDSSTYIRVLGFNQNGRKYLNSVKKYSSLPIITKYIKDNKILDFEMKVSAIYSSIYNDIEQNAFISKEYKDNIIIK